MAEPVQQALAPKIGLGKAHALLVAAIKNAPKDASFEEILLNDKEIGKHLSKAEIKEALKPENYLGHAPALIDRAVSSVRGNLKKN